MKPKINLDLYSEMISVKVVSMLSGKYEYVVPYLELDESPILTHWLRDDDLQEITVCSTNIGFCRTYSKQYKRGSK